MKYIYESPDKGKTIYRRQSQQLKRELIHDYSLLEVKAAELEITLDYYIQEFM